MSKVSPERLSPERWQVLKDVLADALEQKSHAERTAVIESRCCGDETLLAEAESLLREAEALLNEPDDLLEDCAEQATVALWQDEPARAGWRLGAYVVVRELGRGGMGAVYLAKRADGQFEKDVAIKVLKRGTDTDEVLRRFASERHILARLDHPNIAHLLDAGTTDDGLPYFVMEHVAGAPVTRYVREHKLSVTERLTIFLKICSAVEFAHHNHVIHRDLKPGNIMVNSEGEPKLLDFGIAKLLSPGKDSLDVTAVGQERLTPNCASPEQCDGRSVTEASDVYALGALLYELLAGQKPHKFSKPHPSRDEIVRVICEEDPATPSGVAKDHNLARSLRGDLDAIVMLALRKEPELRYAKVSELAGDVRRYLAHEPVHARKGSTTYRVRSAVRSRTTRRILALAAFLVVGVGVVAIWKEASTQSQRNAAVSSDAGKAIDTRKSIAVLPFEDFGNDNSDYFANGVQDNILTDLGKVSDLKVVSRNAVAAYRGKEKNAREIGRDLGVGNILVGSVQRSGDRVRINAQLIDTNTDTQIWAEHYDRKVEDIFALQSELAQTIVTQLQGTLSSGEKAAIWKQPTQDLAAYDLYLRARKEMSQTAGPDPQSSWTDVVSLLQQATERDPKFTMAYCELNAAHLLIYRFGNDHSPERLAAAKEAAETALRLEPTMEESQLALARYYYNGLSDYPRTEQEVAKVASSSSAHSVEYYNLASLVERRLGKWEESLRDGQRAIELDPQNAELVVNQCQTLSGLRRFADAATLVDAAIVRLHGRMPVRFCLVKMEASIGQGDLKGAREALNTAHDRQSIDYESELLWLDLMQKDYAGARDRVDKMSEETKQAPSILLMIAMLCEAEDKPEDAHTAYLQAKEMAEASLAKRPNDSARLGDLASAEAALGAKDEALRFAQRAVELTPVNVDALAGPQCIMRRAEVETTVGERDAALASLRELVRYPFGTNYGDLSFNPTWASLRDDPRFAELVELAKRPF